jgi:putative hydrolase
LEFIPFGDYHIHTVYSDGRSNISEIVNEAKKKGLKEVAITDHGPKNLGTGVKNSKIYIEIKKKAEELNKEFIDFNILVGAEANVISCDGKIDVPQEIYEQLDVLLIGLHPYALSKEIYNIYRINLLNLIYFYTGKFKARVTKINTEALVNAIKMHRPFAVTHPGLKMPVDIKEIAKTCVEYGVYYEINCGHNYQTVEDIKTINIKDIKFIVNSDSHFKKTVGNLESGLNTLKMAGITSDKIVNILH